jgi:hypothetical protein
MDEVEGNDNEVEQNTDGAAILTSDVVPCEIVISYDKNNPSREGHFGPIRCKYMGRRC